MKRMGLLLAASLFFNLALAKSTQLKLNKNLEINFDQARSLSLNKNSSYNYATDSRAESIGLIQKFHLSPRVSAGLGLWLGGLEIELETSSSMIRMEGSQVDLNRWLGVRAKIDFVELIPYGNIAYLYESRDAQLRFSANAGIKLLQPSKVTLNFVGEWSDLVNRQDGFVSQLEQNALNRLENYYLEPVINMGMNYRFN